MSQNTISNYHFKVDWGGQRIGFMEVSGLNIEIETISFREGSSNQDSFRKIPGLLKYSDITLKRVIVQDDNDFFNWINTRRTGEIERRNVVISLLNGEHEPTIVWKIKNAFPTHYNGPVLLSNASSLATETLVLTHEGIEIETV